MRPIVPIGSAAIVFLPKNARTGETSKFRKSFSSDHSGTATKPFLFDYSPQVDFKADLKFSPNFLRRSMPG
jgi:hypothetical protein